MLPGFYISVNLTCMNCKGGASISPFFPTGNQRDQYVRTSPILKSHSLRPTRNSTPNSQSGSDEKLLNTKGSAVPIGALCQNPFIPTRSQRRRLELRLSTGLRVQSYFSCCHLRGVTTLGDHGGALGKLAPLPCPFGPRPGLPGSQTYLLFFLGNLCPRPSRVRLKFRMSWAVVQVRVLMDGARRAKVLIASLPILIKLKVALLFSVPFPAELALPWALTGSAKHPSNGPIPKRPTFPRHQSPPPLRAASALF